MRSELEPLSKIMRPVARIPEPVVDDEPFSSSEQENPGVLDPEGTVKRQVLRMSLGEKYALPLTCPPYRGSIGLHSPPLIALAVDFNGVVGSRFLDVDPFWVRVVEAFLAEIGVSIDRVEIAEAARVDKDV